MVFEILNEKIRQSLKVKGFEEPTKVQKKAIKPILDGNDVLLIGPTGFGKTEACILPIFNRLMEKEHEPIAALYITPLRALNRDMFDRLLWWTERLDLSVTIRHGDTSSYERRKQAEFPDQIFVTTPETLQAILPGSRMKEHLKNVEFVVVDEIHELAESKRGTQLTLGLERLKELCEDFQVIGLSATVGSPEKVANFLGGTDKDVNIIEAISPKELDITVDSPLPTSEDNELSEDLFLNPSVTSKLREIHDLIESHKSALVFTNTREASEVLGSRLRRMEKEFDHEVHHSSLSKDVRVKAEEDFKEGDLKSLICTSSLELGIDIGSIDYVIQYQSPRRVDKLVQRVGRSGHGVGRKSEGRIIADNPDDILEATVIARKGMEGELERTKFHTSSWDVLANQTIGFALDEYDIPVTKAYNIVKNAWTYMNINKEDFTRILKFMNSLRMIWTNSGIKRGKKAWKYYYENLSTIPDVFNYPIVDTVQDQEVGVLDEEFVAEHGETGTTFVVRGRSWRILSVDDGKVYVEPVDEMESAVPAWEGELIPVPRNVASEVGELRNDIAERLETQDKKEVVEWFHDNYPLTKSAALQVVNYIKNQIKNEKRLPTNKSLIVEEGIEGDSKFVVINSCFGTLVNQTLSKFLATLLISELGKSVAIKNDPYRIMIQGASKEMVSRILRESSPEDLEMVIESSIDRTQIFKWRFIHVAKRFGALTREAKWDRMNIQKFVDSYIDSPIYDEAKKEVYLEKMDLNATKEILGGIQSGDIDVHESDGLSPVSKRGLEYQFRELLGPEKPEKEIFAAFKERLLNTKVRLVCMSCGEFSVTKKVRNLDDDIVCPNCGSRRVGVGKSYQDVRKLVKRGKEGKPLSDDEEDKLRRLENSADLVLTYGKKVVIALAGRGVGPDTAIRILAKQREDKEKFYEDILEAEKQFTRTKKYWS
ncbi:MAG: DEAD/DEAH box helicase [Candidatus Aenigmatarchaeota archaeon]